MALMESAMIESFSFRVLAFRVVSEVLGRFPEIYDIEELAQTIPFNNIFHTLKPQSIVISSFHETEHSKYLKLT